MRNRIGAFRGKFLAASLLTIMLLIFGSSAQAQVSGYGSYPSRYLYHWFISDTSLGIPKDTFAIPTAARNHPHLAGKGDKLYRWSTASQKWVEVGGSGTEIDPVFQASDAAGITIENIDDWNLAHSWGNHAGLYPLLTGSYANPSWISSLPWSKITSAPNFDALYAPINTTTNSASFNTTNGNLTLTKGNGSTVSANLDGRYQQQYAQLVLTDAATVVWDYSLGNEAQVTIAGNRTLSITNLPAGKVVYGTLFIIQDATGGRTLTLPTGSKVGGGGAGALTLSSTGGAVDASGFRWNGTTLYWLYRTNFN